MGDDFWCRHLVAMRGAWERIEVVARERLRIAARGIIMEVIIRRMWIVAAKMVPEVCSDGV